MRRWLWLLSIPALALAPAASAQNALVWSTGNDGGSTQFVADFILQHGCFAAVTAFDGPYVALDDLLAYDAVLYFSNSSSGGQDPVAIGNVLADYADTGRRLALATFAWANQGQNTIAGRIIDEAISPLLVGGGSLYTMVDLATHDGSDFFLGVDAISGYFHDDVVLSADAVEHGTWTDGEPLLASKGNVVGVNLFPDGTWGNVSGDYQQLFANALCSGVVANQAATWGGVKALFE